MILFRLSFRIYHFHSNDVIYCFIQVVLNSLIHHSDTRLYQITYSPSFIPIQGFSYYSLLRFGVSLSIQRVMIELFLQLPYHHMIKANITHIPPWTVFLTLNPQSEYTVL